MNMSYERDCKCSDCRERDKYNDEQQRLYEEKQILPKTNNHECIPGICKQVSLAAK